MRSFDDPPTLTPDERLSEVAAILADGVLRLRGRRNLYHCAINHAFLGCPIKPPLNDADVGIATLPRAVGASDRSVIMPGERNRGGFVERYST